MKKIILILTMFISAMGYALQEKNDEEYGKIFAIYNVEEGAISLDEQWKGAELEKNQQLWQRVDTVLPKSSRSIIKKFIVFSDGVFNIDASMSSINDDNKTFQVYVDVVDSFDENNKIKGKTLTYNITHEYGHVLSLNHTQFLDDYDEESGTLTIDEGTLKEDAFLNVFYNKYWKKHYEEALKTKEIEDEDKKYEVQTKYFEKHSDEFVTQYAASELIEDIAESFAYFVMNDKPKDDSIKNNKILFFYNYEELVKIRDEMRNSIKDLLY